YLLKPYHRVQWLQNRGGLSFDHHVLAPMYGVHRAVAADFTGQGRRDVVAVSFLPSAGFPRRQEQRLAAVIYLDRVRAGEVVRHTLEAGTCDHATCTVGDLFGSGRPDVVTGNFGAPGPAVTVWKNLGPIRREPAGK